MERAALAAFLSFREKIVMQYKQSKTERLSKELFLNPSPEYRGAPFWAWNGKIEENKLSDQIDILEKMGMGGFHMHVRTGMESPYLNKEYMSYIQFCVSKAKEKGMYAYLYDEDRWPSGTAGGSITKEHPEYATKTLLFTVNPYSTEEGRENTESVPNMGRGAKRQGNGELLAVYDIMLNEDGTLNSYQLIDEQAQAKGKKWHAYLEHGSKDPWFNDAPYVDTLCDAAIGEFIYKTHETYKKSIGNEFGKVVPSIFTDEPQFTGKTTLKFAKEETDVFLPWTTDLVETAIEVEDVNLLTDLPQLFWNLPEGKPSKVRYAYHNHIADRFVKAYCKRIGDWCKKNHLAFTGHVLGEEGLKSQTGVVGDAMRCYRHFGIPGIDMLFDRHDYVTAKQAQSIVHQMGEDAVISELYGGTGWNCDFRTYKLQGDWQAALGVTLRVPHHFWMTMKGEAKRDYPASIGYQSPWFKEFCEIENHFARLNTALTRGKPYVKIGVIHPIETYWLHFGPEDKTGAKRTALEQQFQMLAETMLFGGIDFDYISENEFSYFCKDASAPICVGEMKYDALIVCGCETLRKSTVERLYKFANSGGDLIFVGDLPKYQDVTISENIERLCKAGRQIPFLASDIMNALEQYRFADIRKSDSRREDHLICQIRTEESGRWFFAATAKNPESHDVDDMEEITFRFKGEWKLKWYDTFSGSIQDIPAEYENGDTLLRRRWYLHESMLLWLEPGRNNLEKLPEKWAIHGGKWENANRITGKVKVRLEEENMLLLDMAQWALNDKNYYPTEELLRIDNHVRSLLKIPHRRKEVTQPYCMKKTPAKDYLRLRFEIESEIAYEQPMLGLEDLADTQIWFNGETVEIKKYGWYVDQCIEKIRLPELRAGKNILEIKVPIGPGTNLENMYLLGDFGVKIEGCRKIITNPVKEIAFGSIVHQGLPFYTGNLWYEFMVDSEEGFKLRVPAYRGGTMRVFVDGQDFGNLSFSPYVVDLSHLPKGEHKVSICLFGTRQNGFGQIHHTPGVKFNPNPNSYRSTGDRFCYEYQFMDAGILKSPEIINGRRKGDVEWE